MYQNNFVLAVLVNGQPLREMPSQYDRARMVYLPFNTEYSLRLKNNNYRRAVAKVWIDGTLATQHGVVVPASGTLDLERFLVDGDLNSGRKFKFVRADHQDVQDPTSSENGLVKVEFELEREQVIQHINYLHAGPHFGSSAKADWTYESTITCNVSNLYSASVQCRSIADENIGATVPGSVSRQQFSSTWIDTDPRTRVTLMLKLVPTKDESPVTVRSTRWVYCPSCRGKCKFTAKFCQHCGANLKDLLV